MYAQISHEKAKARHPEEFKQALEELKLTDPNDVEWGYNSAMAIDGSYNLSQDMKGIDRFIANASNYYLSLLAKPKTGGKKVDIELDTLDLAQDPSRCPHELYGMASAPHGHALWLWDDNCVASPGWNEVIILGGITDGKTTVLRLARDTSWSEDERGGVELLRKVEGQTGWGGTGTDARGHLYGFGSRLDKTAGEWAYTGKLEGSSKTAKEAIETGALRQITDDEADHIVEQFNARHITGSSSGDELRAQLMSEFGLEGIISTPEPTTAQVWNKRISQGRKWKWGESLTAQQLEGYRILMSQTGPSSGMAIDVLSALTNPGNQNRREQAREIIKSIARGQDPEQAYENIVGVRLSGGAKKAKP